MSDANEFVRSYQSDLQFIQAARAALATHPKARFDHAVIDACASRLLACAIISTDRKSVV